MSLLNGYPLRKILKREIFLLILCSPLVLEVAMGVVFAIMIIIMNADELVGLTDQQVEMAVLNPALQNGLIAGAVLGTLLMFLVIKWRKIPLINRKQLTREEWKVIPGLNKQDWMFLAWYIPLSFALLTGGEILLAELFENSEAANQIAIEEMVGIIPVWGMFLTVVIAAPITEEWLFRGLVMFRRDTLEASWLSVIISALLFGLLHGPNNIPSAFSYMGMGFIFAYAAKRTQTVEAAIVYHMLNNLLGFILLYQ
ncbi:CPBP family intramembrane glutamic endopeptidase [Marinilactibacillus piezotolerans]|uniref:CPBP family intramembrane glutamic endopeptidase n=1 Tax=Marinilactibacillus piezotolerans TaxID=258723 RepID=UPI0015C43972|nr:CPBP family intramembrane glutamic endopeptidase [Marinilactibacillus piezotolerans]